MAYSCAVKKQKACHPRVTICSVVHLTFSAEEPGKIGAQVPEKGREYFWALQVLPIQISLIGHIVHASFHMQHTSWSKLGKIYAALTSRGKLEWVKNFYSHLAAPTVTSVIITRFPKRWPASRSGMFSQLARAVQMMRRYVMTITSSCDSQASETSDCVVRTGTDNEFYI